ncbi:autotransporter outer membrane beta-barrel domain-containing protein [uncultured Succinatimonas sp.]|uniref:autotransporter outer membrane beta-barrel domain-containing protein n=1 Tax=uncultured Succinatimonas sp. TaxID=1262973 RepID=UPI0025CC79EE|nr:autotransporter outer membrane beta-barrel domain-containing protein [uncultured Succinatimonas sp.]
MKRIDSCGSLIDPSTLNINSSLTISRKNFKLTPLAIACSILLTSFAAQSQDVPSNDLNNLTGSVKINSQTILENLKESKHKDKPDLVGFFNDDYYWSEDENKYVLAENSRINFEGTENLVKPNNNFSITWADQQPSSQEEKYNATITIKADNKNWTLQYDFAKDGINQDTQKPYSTHTTALSFFENAMMTANDENKSNNIDLKYFKFEPTVNLITKNHLVGAANKGDGRSSLGISLSNKKRNLTFDKEVNFISDFTFYEEGENPDYSSGSSGVENLSVAAGIYNVFGAAEYNATEKVKGFIDNYGVINFKQHATVSVTHTNRSDLSGLSDPRYNEVFGVFNNEGGTTVFENGADIVVKGHYDDGIVSALASASTLGILDPYKQGKIKVTASNDNKVSRIWGVSIDGENNTITTPFDSFGENRLQDQNILSHEQVTQTWNTYITDKTNMQNGNLRFAALSMHGSDIEISDKNKQGYFDIRGDLMAGMLNGEGTHSNTFHNKDKKPANEFWKNSDLANTVQHAEINLTLENNQSKLYGNLYERHRFGQNESLNLKETDTDVTNQSNSTWKNEQINKEKYSLGGKINFTLANGATWMPQQKWYGWNYDFAHTDFYLAYKNKNQITLNNTENVSYERLDLSDQYNLMVWNEKSKTYERVNKTTDKENNNVINDYDLLSLQQDQEKYYFPEIDKTSFTTVNNGIYHLTLNDGVVDTRYMRQAFSFSNVDAINNGDFSSSTIETGVKKLRIQELAGTGGTFNIYVKNKEDHDLIIIDQLASEQAKANSTINFKIWNSTDNDFDETLGIVENKPDTYIQIGRVAKDLKYDPNIELGPKDGDIQSVTYTVKADDDKFTWTQEQKLEYHKQMQNLFITKADIQKVAPDIVEGACLSSSLAYNYAIMDIDRLQKRRGEARHIKDSEDGVWARYRHINSGLTGNDDSADMIQIGYDYKVRNDESYNVYSIAVDYLRGQSDFDESGDSDLNRYSIGLYDTWLLDNGAYLDLTAKVGWFDADMDARFRHVNGYYEVNGDYDFWGASVGAEIGRKFSNKDQWFFEPQTQLTYTYIGSYDFNTDRGVKVESDNVDSLIMRWGLRVGKDFGNSAEEGLYSIYLMGDILHDFLGDQELTVTGLRTGNTAVADFDGERTWYDVGVGFSCTLSENSYMFINYERSLGHDIDNTWEVSAGASMEF